MLVLNSGNCCIVLDILGNYELPVLMMRQLLPSHFVVALYRLLFLFALFLTFFFPSRCHADLNPNRLFLLSCCPVSSGAHHFSHHCGVACFCCNRCRRSRVLDTRHWIQSWHLTPAISFTFFHVLRSGLFLQFPVEHCSLPPRSHSLCCSSSSLLSVVVCTRHSPSQH